VKAKVIFLNACCSRAR